MNKKIKISRFLCLRCGNKWVPRVEKPMQCPACKSLLWNEKRKQPEKKKTKKEVKHDGN